MKEKQISPWRWILIIAAGVFLANILIFLFYFGIDKVLAHNGNKICDEKIQIEGYPSTPGDCYSSCDYDCVSMGYDGGSVTNIPLNRSNDKTPLTCDCQCKGCRKPY